MDTAAALPGIDETLAATTRYLQALTQLDDASARQPSVLPGWTRAHVVAHVSRNADAFTRVLQRAVTGEPATMYDAADARDRDIDRTVDDHDVPGLLEDAHASSRRLEHALTTYDGPADARFSRLPGQPAALPLKTVLTRRLAEVEIHHADLGVGYAPADWPHEFSIGLVRQRQDELADEDGGGPSMVVSSTDVPGLWKFGVGAGPTVHGTVGDVAWWLVGRGRGEGLVCEGELPRIGRWR